MKVEDLLPSHLPDVGDHAISRVGDPLFHGDVAHQERQAAEERRVGVGGVRVRRDVGTRDHQHMHGSLRMDVVERDGDVVLGDELRGEFAARDPTEDAIHAALTTPGCLTLYGWTPSIPRFT